MDLEPKVNVGKKIKYTRKFMINAVEKHQGNITNAANALGISRQWLHRILKESKQNENDRIS